MSSKESIVCVTVVCKIINKLSSSAIYLLCLLKYKHTRMFDINYLDLISLLRNGEIYRFTGGSPVDYDTDISYATGNIQVWNGHTIVY